MNSLSLWWDDHRKKVIWALIALTIVCGAVWYFGFYRPDQQAKEQLAQQQLRDQITAEITQQLQKENAVLRDSLQSELAIVAKKDSIRQAKEALAKKSQKAKSKKSRYEIEVEAGKFIVYTGQKVSIEINENDPVEALDAKNKKGEPIVKFGGTKVPFREYEMVEDPATGKVYIQGTVGDQSPKEYPLSLMHWIVFGMLLLAGTILIMSSKKSKTAPIV